MAIRTMDNRLNGLTQVYAYGDGKGGWVLNAPGEIESLRNTVDEEEDYFATLGLGPKAKPEKDPEKARRREQNLLLEGDQANVRFQVYQQRKKALEAMRPGRVFETSDGETFVYDDDLEDSNNAMAARGEKPREVQFYRSQGIADKTTGETISDLPLTIRAAAGDERFASVVDWLKRNPKAQGRLTPEIVRYLGLGDEETLRGAAKDYQDRAFLQQQLKEDRDRARADSKGALSISELSGHQVGFGGMSLTEHNETGGAKAHNWFNLRINPVAAALDEAAIGVEGDLLSPEGQARMRERAASGKNPLGVWERVRLGLWGDAGLNTPEDVTAYIERRVRNRNAAADEEAVRGTSWPADVVRGMEDRG